MALLSNGKLICLIGIDGSGKSAHAESIIEDMSKQNIRCKHVRCGAHIRFATMPLYYLCKLLKYTRQYETSRSYIHTPRFPEVHRNRVLLRLWPWAVLFDMFILSIVRIRLPMLFGNIVLSDRYMHDVLVELMVVTKNHNFYQTKLGRLFLSLANPNKLVMLDLDEEEAFKRKGDIPNIEYLQIRRRLYSKMAYDLGIAKVKTAGPFDEVHAEIMDILKNGSGRENAHLYCLS